MRKATLRLEISTVFLLLAATARLEAQGSRADYERAAGLERLTADKVFRARVDPHWSADGSRFWYKVEVAKDAFEYVRVDALEGKRAPAFDHARLAEVLSRAAGKPFEARRLPIDRLELDPAGASIAFLAEGKRWRCDLEGYELREEPLAGEPAAALPAVPPAPPEVRASRRTGPETSVTFVNRTGAEASLWWLDPEGQRRSYGTLGAGEEREQHTYAGHVWLATDRAGKALAIFEAVEEPGTAVIQEGKAGETLVPRVAAVRRGSRSESPDGKWQAFFKDQNVHLRSLADGEELSLSTDGSAEDEYSGRVYWSPDSRGLAAVRTRKGDDRKVHYVESSPRDQLQPKLHSYSYLKPGDKVPAPRPRLFDVQARRQIPVDDALFADPWGVTDLRWSPDSRELTFVYNQRGHQVLRLVAVDAETGAARAVIDERSETFIDYAHKQFVHHLDATREVLWMSERDGWNHLYLHDAATGAVKGQITKGEWVVRGVDRVDEERREVWFRACGIRPGQDPYHVHYGRVRLDGSGLTVLTEGDGTHSIAFSPDRRFFVDSWSRADQPPVTELRRSEDGRLLCELERADWTELLAAGWRPPERFVAKGRDGTTDIHGIIIRPISFDPSRRYPVIEEIYAGPQGQHVPKAFRAYHGAQALAELGFIVVKIDGMGTSWRSKKFHDLCWRNLGDSGFPDRIPWIRAAAERYPYMDATRVGIYGGSAGGQSALRALLAHGDFYVAAAADCGCHDNRMDKVWWNELWMGWPVGPHYAEQSNVTNAHRLQGKLLLTVGEMDENVDPASTMQVVGALIRADKDFELVIVPGRGHGAGESPYGRRRRMDFFVRHLLGVEPRWQRES